MAKTTSKGVEGLGKAIAAKVRAGPVNPAKAKAPRALAKPVLPTGSAVLQFAEGGAKPQPTTKSGQVPGGDVRMVANIRKDLHMKLKIRAAQESTTIGELIERLIEKLK